MQIAIAFTSREQTKRGQQASSPSSHAVFSYESRSRQVFCIRSQVSLNPRLTFISRDLPLNRKQRSPDFGGASFLNNL